LFFLERKHQRTFAYVEVPMDGLVSRRLVMMGAAAAMVPGGSVPLVRLETRLGSILIRVQTPNAPVSVGDFLKYVANGSYNGGRFFRVVRPDNDHGTPQIDVVQGGVRPGAAIAAPVAHETTQVTGLRHLDGTVSLTRDKPGSGSGSEFFICVGAQPVLDFGGKRNPDGQGFAAFGQVTSGMDVVRKIWGMEASGASEDRYTAGQILRRPVKILSARVLLV
jgi:peptidyl-prolyl cis-trans isomerase A (cyclophilin A)